MILSGLKVSGYNYIGRPTLATIGNPAYWFDYRFNLVTQTYSSVLRANSLGDLSTNSLLLQSTPVSANTRRPVVFSDGLGMDAANLAITAFSGAAGGKLDFIHKGAPHLLMCVIKITGTTGNNISFPSIGTAPGFGFRIANFPNPLLSAITFNDAGSNIGAQNTAANSIPLDEFILVHRLYYGSGTGSNNTKMWIKDSQSTFTFNPTFGTNTASPDKISAWNSNGSVDYRMKMCIGYDLTGKSIAECDAFRTLAVNTLKSDLEYSSLVTP
jgi:hypothetical protein